MDFNAILEFIGVDVIFLGSVTMLATYFGFAMWRSAPQKPDSQPDPPRIVRKLLQRLRSVGGHGALPVSVLVIGATVAGMIINGVSDSLLDSKLAAQLSKTPWIHSFLKGDEDILKEKALKDVTENLRGLPKVAAIFGTARAAGDDGVKGLTQEALARVYESGHDPLISSMRYEFMVVKTLRSLWLLASLLGLIAFAAIARRSRGRNLSEDAVLRWWTGGVIIIGFAGLGSVPWPAWWKAADSLRDAWFLSCGLAATLLAFFTWRDGKRLTALSLWFVILSITFLQLWATQSDRYYKKLLYAYASILEPDPTATGTSAIGFVEAGACDGSAAAAIPGTALFISASDEDNILRVYALDSGPPVFQRDFTSFLGTKKGDEADIEGATRLGDRIFWITSHGTNKRGSPKPERRRLFATTVSMDGTTIRIEPSGSPYTRLVEDLVSDGSLKGLDLEEASGRRPDDGGLNIEGLATDPDGNELWLGLRSPLVGGKALIIRIQNPLDLVNGRAASAKIAEPMYVDLGGLGIRGLEYAPSLGEYLVVAGPVSDEGDMRLYRWMWPANSAAVVNDPAILGLHPESVTVSDQGTAFHLVTDEGDVKIGEKTCKDLSEARRSFRVVPLTLTPR